MPPLPERLTIEGFAGIEHLELQVRPFTVLIGPQSVGKSIVARLLFFFNNTPRSLYLAALRDEGLSASAALLDRFAAAIPPQSHPAGPARINFEAHGMEFILEFSQKKADPAWIIKVPQQLRSAYQQLARGLEEEDGETEGIEESNNEAKAAYLDATREMWPHSDIPPRFVPAGRSFFSQIERDVPAYLENASTSLDPFMSDFWRFLLVLRKRSKRLIVLPESKAQLAKAASVLVKELLTGEFVREGTRQYIRSVDGRKLAPRLWSSGQQEVQPLALLLQQCCEGLQYSSGLYIEEPEAHLFPSAQRIITELIALAFNAPPSRMNVFLTTHSPYILTSLNNLLLAGQLHHRELPVRKRMALSRVVSQDRALLPEKVGAYYMDRNGCDSIIDNETGLIGSTVIDSVSTALNEQFDALLDIDRS